MTVVLAHVAEGHHRRQEGRQRQGQRQHLAASPQEEFQDDLEFQAFADQFIDVQPQELHHQDEYGDREDREERSYERLQYEQVQLFHEIPRLRSE